MSRLPVAGSGHESATSKANRNVKRAGPSLLWASRTPALLKSEARPPATMIGIHEGRKNEGSAKNPPKGKFVRGVFFPALTGWANFCHASGVGPGMHRLRKHAVVVRLPGRPDEGSAENLPKGKIGSDVFFPALTGWANFCHASCVGPGVHRLRKHAGVVRLPGRPDGGSEKNPPKGKFVRGFFFPALTGWANFCHASCVGPGTHRLPKNAGVVRLPGRKNEGSAKNPPKGKFAESVLFMSRLKPLPTKLMKAGRLRGRNVKRAGPSQKTLGECRWDEFLRNSRDALTGWANFCHASGVGPGTHRLRKNVGVVRLAGRPDEGSAENPLKGKIGRGVLFPALTGWANFCHSGVGPGTHRLRKHAGVVRLPGRPDEGSAENLPKGKFVEDVLFMSRLKPRTTELPNMSRLRFTKRLWVNSAGIHEKRVSATLLANIVQDTKCALDALSASICGGHSMLCPYG
jgi:hypothetical protein